MKKRNGNSYFVVRHLLILFLSAALITPGCVTIPVKMYPGEALPPEKIAVIKTFGNTITGIDGNAPIKANKVEVLPGLHEVIVQVERVSYIRHALFDRHRMYETQIVHFTFNAQAGHEYNIEWRYQLFVVIVDTQSVRPYSSIIRKTLVKSE